MKKEWKAAEVKELKLNATAYETTEKDEYDETYLSTDGRLLGYKQGTASGDGKTIIIGGD